jgi:hypothetical protein
LQTPFVSEFLAKLTVTFAIADPEPLRVTLAGDTLQVELRGPPPHVNRTVPVKPFTGVTVSVNVAVCAIGMVCEAGEAKILKFGAGRTIKS